MLTTSCRPDWPLAQKKMGQLARAGALVDPLLFLADRFGSSFLWGSGMPRPRMASRSTRGFRERTWRRRAAFLAHVRVHSNVDAVRRPRQDVLWPECSYFLVFVSHEHVARGGMAPQMPLVCRAGPGPESLRRDDLAVEARHNVNRLAGVCSSVGAALRANLEPTRQLAAVHSRRWLSRQASAHLGFLVFYYGGDLLQGRGGDEQRTGGWQLFRAPRRGRALLPSRNFFG